MRDGERRAATLALQLPGDSSNNNNSPKSKRICGYTVHNRDLKVLLSLTPLANT